MIKIIAVTACTTGIAHTYMAAEKLSTTGKELGINLVVETRGLMGVTNQLTDEDIKESTGVIIASDIKIELERFNGKPVLNVPVREAIHQPKALIERIISGEVTILDIKKTANSNIKIYKHLMNGISYMLPFLVSSGILISLSILLNLKISLFLYDLGSITFGLALPVMAGYIAYSISDRPGLLVGLIGGYLATIEYSTGFMGALIAGFISGYIVLGLKYVLKKLPKSLDAIKTTVITPLIGVIMIGFIMLSIQHFITPLNNDIIHLLTSLNGVYAIIFGMVLSGMMAYDMGGPINKIAYMMGIISLFSSNDEIVSSHLMATVMLGGMVPPLGIALSTTLFPKKFNQKLIKLGKSNYMKGMSFVTEGAIPFVSYHKMVMPALVAGALVGGAISMSLKVSTPIAHGGIWMLPFITHWHFFILALFSGTVVSATLLFFTLPTRHKTT